MPSVTRRYLVPLALVVIAGPPARPLRSLLSYSPIPCSAPFLSCRFAARFISHCAAPTAVRQWPLRLFAQWRVQLGPLAVQLAARAEAKRARLRHGGRRKLAAAAAAATRRRNGKRERAAHSLIWPAVPRRGASGFVNLLPGALWAQKKARRNTCATRITNLIPTRAILHCTRLLK